MLRVLMAVAVMVGCSRTDSGAAPSIDLSPFQSQRDLLCGAFDPSTIERCDRSTFHILMTSSCGQPLPLQYEQPEGKWNRDTESCYPEDSRSETSQDTYLSLILSQDTKAIQRAYNYAKERDWETGLPEGNVGNIRALVPIMRGYALTGESDGIVDDGIEAAKKAFTGHRGHLLAGYLWAVSRLRGGLTVGGTALLKKLHDETPDSPYLSCLYHRHSDGNQRGTKSLLRIYKPGNFGWGSAPNDISYVLAVGCLQGD